MERLTRQQVETVLYKLFVFTEGCPFQYLVAAVIGIVEQWMADVLHVCSDLVCAPCFQLAADQGHIP